MWPWLGWDSILVLEARTANQAAPLSNLLTFYEPACNMVFGMIYYDVTRKLLKHVGNNKCDTKLQRQCFCTRKCS